MKYDRPVRELLVDCVRELHQPFTREAVIEWFRLHYPDVKSSTVTAHMVGLTVGRNPETYPQLTRYPPLIERVGRGMYQRAGHDGRPAARAPTLPVRAPSAESRSATSDVVLVGCVKSKRVTAAPAADLYTSTLFARRRRYAEASGAPWFVVSSRWGLVAPDEVIAPYDVYLGDQSAAYRRAWGEFVVEQLHQHLDLRGTVVEIHAGDHYVDALRPPVERAGATLVDPVDAHSMGETLAWYDHHEPAPNDDDAGGGPDDVEPHELETLITRLTDVASAISPGDLAAAERRALRRPGLYTWWVDADGAAELSTGLRHRVEPGLIYAGQTGATRWPSGLSSKATLEGRLLRNHARGNIRGSTFRHTLAAILRVAWGYWDEATLTAWVEQHLRVIGIPVSDGSVLGATEAEALRSLDPPLNLDHMTSTPVREALRELRRQLPRG